MDDTGELRKCLLDVIGQEGCGVSCEQAEIFEMIGFDCIGVLSGCPIHLQA